MSYMDGSAFFITPGGSFNFGGPVLWLLSLGHYKWMFPPLHHLVPAGRQLALCICV